jgi:hypothetical protein
VQPDFRRWTRHVVYRTTCLKTTWTFRVAAPALLAAAVWLTASLWTAPLARSLVCDGYTPAPGTAVLLENFDVNYLVFQRGAELRRSGMAGRVIVPVESSPDPAVPNLVSAGFVEVMARVSRIGAVEVVPFTQVEPISLHAAMQVREYLRREGIRSVLVIAPGFRSRRSSLLYGKVLGAAGIDTTCMPVFGEQTPETWTRTWHGVEQVLEQHLKLAYYRLAILPRVAATPE